MTDRKKEGVESIKRTFDFFFPIFFLMKFYFIQAHKCCSKLCIAPIFVFETRIAGLTPFNLQR